MAEVLIGLVGDLLVDRDDPAAPFADSQGLIDAADLMFGNLEGVYSDHPTPPLYGAQLTPRAEILDVFAHVGFDVLSMANNHIVDGGHAALLQNRARLLDAGVRTCGAGKNLAEARQPALFEAQGLNVAVLAYASIFPFGYDATATRPGLAPIRAYDLWRPLYEGFHAPGCMPHMSTTPDEGDMARLAEDIAKAKAVADLVFVSCHWGDFLRPYHITDHETRTARFCIDQGADMIIGHHHHTLRGMEWYKGKPIFYGLGHFVFDLRLELDAETIAMIKSLQVGDENYGVLPREGWPLLPLHPDSRMTVYAWAKATKAGVSEIGFAPCRLRPDGSVAVLDPDSEEGREVTAYVERSNVTQRLNARISGDDAPVIAGRRTLRVLPAAG